MPFDLDLDTMMRESVSSAGEGVPSTDATPSVEADPIESAVESAKVPATEGNTERVRGPDGKFAKVEENPLPDNNKIAADAKIGEPTVPDQTVTTGIQTPVSWSAAAKAEFSKLPLAVQEAVAKREMEVSQGFKQYGEKVKAYEAIDKVLEPLRPALQQAGLSADQYIQRLRAAEQTLESNPVEGIKWLAQTYGVDLAQIASGQTQEVAPEIQTLRNEVLQLRQWRDHQEQARQQAVQTDTHSEIERFKSDPKNEFFEQVRERMGRLIKAGEASTLSDAYEQACLLEPNVRQIMQARQADALQKSIVTNAKTKVAASAPAVGVKGNGAVNIAPTGDWTDTLREVTRAAHAG